MKKNNIWTNINRKFLYTKLVEKFGPYKEWELKHTPKKNNKDYEEFCEEIAKIIGAKSGGAVSNQIDWALSVQENTIKESHITTWLRNKHIAKEAGFIDNSLIPKAIICEY